MSEPEGRGMSERLAALKAALISVEQALKFAEGRVEALRKEDAELRTQIEEATARERPAPTTAPPTPPTTPP
jgi:phage shock protein A